MCDDLSADFQGNPGVIGLDGALHPGTDVLLLNDRVGPQLVIGVLQGLANGIKTDVVARREYIRGVDLVAHRIQCRPLTILVLGQEIFGVGNGLKLVSGGGTGSHGRGGCTG